MRRTIFSLEIDIVILSLLCMTRAFEEYEEVIPKPVPDYSERRKVELRAVFLNCEPEDLNTSLDSDAKRFERHELFKHSVLKDCDKKLTLTVKITSELDNSGDEYLPIEHVFDGSNTKRVRLLDPYILRLRRDLPLQAYQLRRLETVSGVLLSPTGPADEEIVYARPGIRIERDVSNISEVDEGNISDEDGRSRSEKRSLLSDSDLVLASRPLQTSTQSTKEIVVQELENCDKHLNICSSANNHLNQRYKRNEYNIVVEGAVSENKPLVVSDEHSHRAVDREILKDNDYDNREQVNNDNLKPTHHTIESMGMKHAASKKAQRKRRTKMKVIIPKVEEELPEMSKSDDVSEDSSKLTTGESRENTRSNKIIKNKLRSTSTEDSNSRAKDYIIYEIGPPELWYMIHVQLFEKLSTPDGKTIWNDLTKGELASVSSLTPEWTTQDLNVRYRSTKWVAREEYTLPQRRLYLLASLNRAPADSAPNGTVDNNDPEFIVVPEEDIIGFQEESTHHYTNNSESASLLNSSKGIEQKHRRVMIRTVRAIFKDLEDSLNVASQGQQRYLTLRHRLPYKAQIDVEARAEGNELVRIGSFGRISIAVADSTRRTRTILHLQIGNTGLAAARFRVAARDFDPILTDLVQNKDTSVMAGPILIPPRHTRSIRLELPIEIPVENVHCSVILLNDQDQAVAVRDVTIKKSDRCFCVWHCDCVCLSDDPKLLCREMDEAAQKAAGLFTNERTRHARSICYVDVVTLNMFVMFIGAVLFLLLLGLLKATVGLVFRPIGTAGLQQLLQTPRRLERYYEKSLRNRCVVYDNDCWPVHPDTKKRTVRLVSLPMEFVLNTIFFVSVPCILIYELIKALLSKVNANDRQCRVYTSNNSKECYSSHDIQDLVSRRRRLRDGLRRWMTPPAQELSTELWRKSFNMRSSPKSGFMQPLLKRGNEGTSNATQDSMVDSEQDDTDYVLTQMQKSRESLARNQKKVMDLEPSGIAPSVAGHY